MTQEQNTHESAALSEYTSLMTAAHSNLDQCELAISTKHPHIGASPDAFVQCDCRGEHVVEIKCLYSLKSQMVSEDGDTDIL